jgi:hypothetical protein
LLAYITGSVDQELLLRNEYLVTENRLLRKQIQGRIQLSDGERKTLAEIGKQLGKQALAEIATIVKLAEWHVDLPYLRGPGGAVLPHAGGGAGGGHRRCQAA